MQYMEWKIWNGGKCPVSPETLVQVQLRSEYRERAESAHPCQGPDCRWTWEDLPGDIIAYREVIEPRVVKSLWVNVADTGLGMERTSRADADNTASLARIGVLRLDYWNTGEVTSTMESV